MLKYLGTPAVPARVPFVTFEGPNGQTILNLVHAWAVRELLKQKVSQVTCSLALLKLLLSDNTYLLFVQEMDLTAPETMDTLCADLFRLQGVSDPSQAQQQLFHSCMTAFWGLLGSIPPPPSMSSAHASCSASILSTAC